MTYYVVCLLSWFLFFTWKASCSCTRLGLLHYVWAVPLILLTSLRGEVGPDTSVYLNNAQDLLWWGDRAASNEAGYEVIVRGFGLLTHDVPALHRGRWGSGGGS